MCTSPNYRIKDFQECDNTGRPRTFIMSYKEFDRKKTAFLPPRFSVSKCNCDKCMQCRIGKKKEWADRGIVELEEWDKATMVTLTYDDEHIPKSKYYDKNNTTEKEITTLSVEEHEKFLKRLRKAFFGSEKSEMAYMMCGEYGSAEKYKDAQNKLRVGTERPHYHYILFGIDFDDKKFYKWSYNEWNKEKNPLYKSEKLNKLWKFGHADINDVTPESIGYVCGYITKKLKGQKAEQEYYKKNRIPPFFLTSKGIGKKYFEKNKEAFYEKKKLYKKTKKGLQTIKLSRYYLKLIEKENEKKAREIKKEAKELANYRMDEILKRTTLKEDEYLDLLDEKNKKIYGDEYGTRGAL